MSEDHERLLSSEKPEPRTLSRRGFLRLAGGGVALVVVGACGDDIEASLDTSITTTDPPIDSVDPTTTTLKRRQTTIPRQSTTTSSTSTTTTQTAATTTSPPDTTIAETIPPTTPETLPLTPEVLIGAENLVDGKKIGDINITNPDGTPLVAIPLILNKDINSYEQQLKRGAALENWREDLPLLGEDGEAIIFGHRVTQISPDFDGNGESDNPAVEQFVFRHIDLVVPGAVMTITTDRARITYKVFEERPQEIIDMVDPNTGNRIEGADERVRSQELAGGRKLVKLVACHPPESVRQRMVVRFEQVFVEVF